MFRIFFLVVLLFFIIFSENIALAEEKPEYSEQIYLSEKQALDMVFDDLKVEKREIVPSDEEKITIQKILKRKLKEKSFIFYIGKKNDKEIRYAIILDENGKHFPITFIVSLNLNAEVEQAAVMVYREKRGDAVKQKRFLAQFKNKSSKDPVEINNDIVHLTGATISSWAMAFGIKKAIILTEELIVKSKIRVKSNEKK